MLRRLLVALPLTLALGCGASPPPAANPPSSAGPSEAAPSTQGTPPTAAGTAAPPTTPSEKGSSASTSSPSAATTVPADAPISTKITQDDVLAQVNKNAELFNTCYTMGAGASKSYRAKVTIKATVSPVGNVNVVEVIDSTAKNAKVDACVVEAFKKLVFPRPKGSGATVFTFPLKFEGIEQVK